MDEQTIRAEYKREFNAAVGRLLTSLREKAGLSLEQVAEAMAQSRLKKVKRLEVGEESIHGQDLMELVQIYGDDLAAASGSIQKIAEETRAKYPLPINPPPGASHRTEKSIVPT